ncbi:MAG: hypothetical protein IPN53_04190 [Comamonadaceae bacterium]|nr:hypothetical protein [Comamonadaceae bacterium]
MDTKLSFRFSPAHCMWTFLKLTPINLTLDIRGRIKEVKEREVLAARCLTTLARQPDALPELTQANA